LRRELATSIGLDRRNERRAHDMPGAEPRFPTRRATIWLNTGCVAASAL
jgi:hypothetical protein